MGAGLRLPPDAKAAAISAAATRMAVVTFYGVDLNAHDGRDIARLWVEVLGWTTRDRADGGVGVVASGGDPAHRS